VALDLFRLLVFVTVVDRNGYSAAGRHLHLAQATVSHHVAALQKSLATELLRYSGGAVQLTPAGHEVYRVALVMLEEQERLGIVLEDLRSGRGGRVRLGASMAFEQEYFFQRVVAPFRAAHEGVFLSLRFGHSRSQAQAVLDKEIDLAYVIRWNLPPDVRFELLHTARFTFLAARDHPLARRESVSVDEIARAGLITAPLSSLESTYYNHVLVQCGIAPGGSVLEIDGLQSRVLAAEAGLGLVGTFMPSYAGDAVPGRLVALPVEGHPADVDVGLIRRPAEPPAGGAAALADWLRQVSSR
jgi:DNA-binding transcriptional LysR family regulator